MYLLLCVNKPIHLLNHMSPFLGPNALSDAKSKQ